MNKIQQIEILCRTLRAMRVHECTIAANEIENLRAALIPMTEIATRRWRSLPAATHEKQTLVKARAVLGNE